MPSLIPLFLTLLPLTSAASQGSLSLWSDSSCQPGATSNFGERDPVALNYTLSADVCGNPGANVHSYIVNSRPTCANGTVAAFAFYSTANCVLPSNAEWSSGMHTFRLSTEYDEKCLALVEFSSVAFICDGFSGSGSGSASVRASSSVTPVSSSPKSASATPVAPSTKITAPIYTTASVPTGINPSGAKPSGTGASVRPSSKTFGSSPATFTGAAVTRGIPVVGVIALVGAALVL